MEVKNSTSRIIPERIREARISKGYTMQELGDILEVTRQSISQYELGHSTPSWHIMQKLIEQLDIPLNFFFKPIENREGPRSAIFFRSLRSTAKKSRDMVSARIGWLYDIYLYLNKSIDFPELDLPELNDFLKEELDEDYDYIDDIALKLREHWSLGMGPINNLTLLLEKKGFIITKLEIGDQNIDAFSQWINGKPFIFLGSDKNSAVRTRFDIAHELGHLILHTYVEQEDLKNKNLVSKIEKEANRFAGVFLMPRESFVKEVVSTSIDHFVSLKMRWKVSIAAMIYRCSELRIFSDSQLLYLNKQISYKNMRKKEPLDDTMTPESHNALKQAINLLLDNEIITVNDILEELPYNSREIEILCNLERGLLSVQKKEIPLYLKIVK